MTPPRSTKPVLAAAVIVACAVAAIAPPAAVAQPLEVVVGRDIDAWRGLHERDLDEVELAEAYRAFIDEFPTSSLAEVAWARLDALGAAEPIHPAIGRSFAQHKANLERTSTAVGVAPLTEEGTPARAYKAAWGLCVAAAAGYGLRRVDGQWGGEAHAGMGLRVHRGRVALTTRLNRGATWVGDVGLRYAGPAWRPMFVEATADTRLRGGLRIGAAFSIDDSAIIEISAGAVAGTGGVAPGLRLELTHALR